MVHGGAPLLLRLGYRLLGEESEGGIRPRRRAGTARRLPDLESYYHKPWQASSGKAAFDTSGKQDGESWQGFGANQFPEGCESRSRLSTRRADVR